MHPDMHATRSPKAGTEPDRWRQACPRSRAVLNHPPPCPHGTGPAAENSQRPAATPSACAGVHAAVVLNVLPAPLRINHNPCFTRRCGRSGCATALPPRRDAAGDWRNASTTCFSFAADVSVGETQTLCHMRLFERAAYREMVKEAASGGRIPIHVGLRAFIASRSAPPCSLDCRTIHYT